MSTEHSQPGPGCGGAWGVHKGPPTVPGMAGPHGQSVPMAAPYSSAPPGNVYAARQMMNNSVPLDMVQMNRGGNAPGMSGAPGGAMPPTFMPQGGMLSPPGVPFAPGMPAKGGITPALYMPGADPGIIHANVPPGMNVQGGVMLAQGPGGAPPATGQQPRVAAQRTQIRFSRPTGMKISWFAQGPDGKPAFSNVPLEAPARYNFPQGAIYRLKISNIEGRPGLEVYPTMEVVPCNAKTDAFLAHSAVPIEFTQADFKQIADGNYVTKVIYLPDPQFQDVAGTGTDEIVSTTLDPGADPIHEALRRGSILVILRMGNVDQEAPNTPPLTATPPAGQAAPPHQGPPNLQPRMMAPYPGFMPPGVAPYPHGGPQAGAPGYAPGLPPGFPPGAGPQGAPRFSAGPAPTTGGNAPPSTLMIPPAPGIFAPPPVPGTELKTETTSKQVAPPVPVAPPPAPKVEEIAAPATPPPAPTTEVKKTPEPMNSSVPAPLAPAPNLKTPGETAPAAPVAAPPSAPVEPKVSVPNAVNPGLPPPLPPLPLTPEASKIEVPEPIAPPAPQPPMSKASASSPGVTPASNPALPTIPVVDGPTDAPAFPAVPGTIRPVTPAAVPGTSAAPMPNGIGQAR